MATNPPTIAQVFQQNGWEQWWSNTGIQHFSARAGSNNCTDPGASEYGNDYTPSYRAIIHSITYGTVIYSQIPPDYYTGGHTSIGYVIQIQQGDGSIIHFQHMASSNVKVGQVVGRGDIVGIAGGCPQGCYGSGGCTCTDAWSTGPHIEVRFSTSKVGGVAPWCNGNWIDPVPVVSAIVGNPAAAVTGGVGGLIGGAVNTLLNGNSVLPNPLALNADVAGFFSGIDQFLNFVSPIPIYRTVSLFGVDLPDPGMVWDVFINVMTDFGVLFWRLILISWGVYMCFKVINNFTNITGKIGGAIETGAKVAAGAMAFV